MQNRYVGDVGDFGKYGLLRRIFRETPAYKLGIVWYLVSNGYPICDHKNSSNKKTGANDGKHTKYLENPQRFEDCDSDLFKRLGIIVGNGPRHVSEIKCLFHEGTVFYDEQADYCKQHGRNEREKKREIWLSGALKAVNSCNVVFLDPDNGLQIPSVGRYELRGPKHVYYDEVDRFIEKSRVLVIYHHLTMHKNYGNHDQQICDRTDQLKDRYPGFVVWALRFRPYSPRAFFILANDEHHHGIKDQIEAFMRSSWERHFDLYFDGIKCIY